MKVFLFLILINSLIFSQELSYSKQFLKDSLLAIVINDTINPGEKFHAYYLMHRDTMLTQAEDMELFWDVWKDLKEASDTLLVKDSAVNKWVFPVEGYGTGDIGGGGTGYITGEYDYFKKGAKGFIHPAHDIFVRDRNQDNLDDRTGKPVYILSVNDGIVITVNTGWTPQSTLKGGNYIYIYDPYMDAMVYYAHNDSVFVKPGDLVKRGDKIATMGRTGLNAYPKRSPTHLHFMTLKIDNGYPKPYNPLPELKDSEFRMPE